MRSGWLGMVAGLCACLARTGPAQSSADSTKKAPPVVSPPKLYGYVQARESWQQDVGLTATLNRVRLGATGTIASDFSWRIMAEYRTGAVGTGRASVSLADAFIRWKHGAMGVQAGQYKTPFTREYLMSIADLESADRSTVVDSLAPKRDLGITADYDIKSVALVTIGVFNGEGQNVTANRDSSVMGVARLAVKPVPQVTLAVNGVRYFSDSTRYGGDVTFETARVTVRAEYLGQHRDSLGGRDDRGWYSLGAFKPGKDLQVFAKYEYFNRPQVDEQQKNRAWTVGGNLWFAGNAVRFTAAYVSRKVGSPGLRKGTAAGQVQVRF